MYTHSFMTTNRIRTLLESTDVFCFYQSRRTQKIATGQRVVGLRTNSDDGDPIACRRTEDGLRRWRRQRRRRRTQKHRRRTENTVDELKHRSGTKTQMTKSEDKTQKLRRNNLYSHSSQRTDPSSHQQNERRRESL